MNTVAKPTVYVSTQEAARQLGVSLPTIRGLITDGQLDAWPQRTVTGTRIHAWKVSQASIDSYPRRARLAIG